MTATAQNGAWGDLDGLLAQSLIPGRETATGYWLPDSTDPDRATEAIGITYPVIVGAAGNTDIVVGHFRRQGDAFTLAGRVTGLFGLNPRETAFHSDRIELTTTTPTPGDPRCCPTGTTRWRIDRASRAARPVN